MDETRFDAWTRRRFGVAAGGLLATALGLGLQETRAKKKHRRPEKRGLQAQATCAKPGPGKNLDGCDFSCDDLSWKNLNGSSVRGTIFTRANLTHAKLLCSTARDARFVGAEPGFLQVSK